MPLIQIPSNRGSVPNWNEQIDSPILFNMFLDKEGAANFTPGLNKLLNLNNCRAIWETPFDGGCYIVVGGDQVFRVKANGSKKPLYSFIDSGLPVEICENSSNQLLIVDGDQAFVIEQKNNDNVTVLGEAQGFSLTHPGSCCTINSFMVVLDIDSGQWQIGNPNNALVYDPININLIDPELFSPIAVRNMNNNLFIFGSAGIERWEPTLNVNLYLFPLQKDMNFEVNFGAISTRSVVSNVNTIYFLSSRFIPMQISSQGLSPLRIAGDSKEDDINGISKEISQYPDVNQACGSFYTFRGNLFYQLTFEESENTWLYCVNSNTFSNTDDYILGSAFTTEYVILSDGLYQLSLIPADKKRYWVSSTQNISKGQSNNRGLLNGVELNQTQGSEQSERPEYVELSISVDRRTWSNTVRIPMGMVGQFNYRTIWRTNISGRYFTFKIAYYGSYPFTMESVTAVIS